MERSSFQILVSLVKNDPVFHCRAGGRCMAAPGEQLLVYLKDIGTQGSDASTEDLSLLFGIGSGASYDYIGRYTSALLSHYQNIVRWPSADERKMLSQKMAVGFDCPNCVGLVDGTLLPLAFKPALSGEDYYTRKGGYAINALIFCDDMAKVTYMVVGWPGSSHDNRVWSNSAIYNRPLDHFDNGQYILGDSAFRASRYIVPAYKKLQGGVISREKEFFNYKLAKLRIRVEHCIGVLKARFQYFRGIRVIIKTTEDMNRIIRLFMSAVVVHNLLILEPIPSDLQDDLEEKNKIEEVDDGCGVNETDYSDDLFTYENRRDQLFRYVIEKDARF
ncbi:unnamed protein product [Phytophthora fragariaefolia]|uniref:Unnamed protein product n=1 Tax=Phytophthora fragariaefolia TaxID=1490495 RepID=A0A9W6X7D4_9STRA|nr:unnamed protein product [Phytophthora fragariaefolia]